MESKVSLVVKSMQFLLPPTPLASCPCGNYISRREFLKRFVASIYSRNRPEAISTFMTNDFGQVRMASYRTLWRLLQ